MDISNMIKKLRLLPGQRVLILSLPPAYHESLQPHLPYNTRVDSSPNGEYEFIHLFVKDSAELNRLVPLALEALKYDATFWVSYPKKSSGVPTDLKRDVGWEVLSRAGLRPIAQVAADETWSALRFRPVEAVGI